MPQQPPNAPSGKTPAARPRLALLDSGVGGLSIAVPLSQRLGGAAVIDYLADTQFYPYGTKAQPELIRRVLAVVGAYLAKHPDCQQLIVACNTASTLCLDALRGAFALPIIGVVPALKPACGASAKPKVGLLATEATVARPYIDELMADFGQGKGLVKVGSQSLVDLAERLLHDPYAPATAATSALLKSLNGELAPLRRAIHAGELDTVVLGCTHFPWLKAILAIMLNPSPSSGTSTGADQPVHLLDSTCAIIRRSLELANLGACAERDASAEADASAELSLPPTRSIEGCYYTTHTPAPATPLAYAAGLFTRRERLGVG